MRGVSDTCLLAYRQRVKWQVYERSAQCSYDGSQQACCALAHNIESVQLCNVKAAIDEQTRKLMVARR